MKRYSDPSDPRSLQVSRKHEPEPVPASVWEQVAAHPYGYDYADESGSGALIEYWQILKRRKGMLILLTFMGGLLALLLTIPQTPVFQAKATLEIQSLNTEFMNMRQVSPVDDGNIVLTREMIDTQIQILRSDTLIDRTLKKLGWVERKIAPGMETSRASAWRKALNLPEPEVSDPKHTLLTMAKRSLKVRSQGLTRIIEILVDSTDPRLAADFANTISNEYIESNLEARWKMTQRTGEWLTGQLDEMRIQLERSEDRLQDYARGVGLIITEKQGSVDEDKLRQVQEELSKAQADRIAKQSRFELADSGPVETLADVLDDVTLREYQVKLTELRRAESDLSTTYTPEHSKLRRIAAQIATVEAALVQERSAVVQRIRNDYEEAVRREKLLDLDYMRQARLLGEQSEKAIQYNILKREVDSNRQLYETMLERVRSASVASALRASNVRVVDQAKPPRRPYKPRLAINAILGLTLGGFLGVVFVIIRERADRTLQEPGDLNFYLNLPELGVIPTADSKRTLKGYYGAKSTSTDEHQGKEKRVELVVWNKKPSMLAESFRATLTSILFSGSNGSRPRVLVMTSSSPSEGKSTITANLAITLAEVNRKVLLVDGDLRKPRQHDIFEINNARGLSDVLKDSLPVAQAIDGSIRETQIPNLFLLPSGAESAGSTNLLYSERMAQVLETLAQEFDMVLIDTPPMLQIPDARILGRMSDAVILVIRAGRTTRDMALAAKQRLTEDGARVLGTVLNYFDPKRTGGTGRYGYGYYGYGKNYTYSKYE
jgi:capsular exopolysaccharide synthesis family protein